MNYRIFFALLMSAMVLGFGANAQTFSLPEDSAVHDEWGFSGVVRNGDTLYLAGVGAELQEDEKDPEAAIDRAFIHIEKTLKLAGADWSDVIEMTSYHTDLGSQIMIFRKVKDRYVGKPFPAWTAVGVTRLVPPNSVAEITVVARVRSR